MILIIIITDCDESDRLLKFIDLLLLRYFY